MKKVRMKNFIKKKFKKIIDIEDIKYILENSKYKFTYEIFFLFISFLTSWCFANLTSKEFYGTYLFIISVLSFFTFLSFFGINQALTQYVAQDYDYFLITSIRKRFFLSISGTFAIFIFAIIYNNIFRFNIVILVSLLIGGVFFPFIHSSFSINFFFDGKGEFKKDFIYRLTNLIIVNFFVLILIFLTNNITLHFILLFSTQTIINSLFLRNCIKLIENRERNLKLENEAFKYGFFLTKYGIFSFITLNLNNLIIGIIYGPNLLAIYLVGCYFPMTVINFLKPSLSVLLTKYSKKESRISKKFVILLIFGSIILFFGTLISLPFFIQILFPKYLDSVQYGVFYSFIILIYPIEVVIGYYFRGKIIKRVIRNAFIIPDILNLLFFIPLLLFFGIYGLILSEILSHFFRFIIYLVNKSKIEFK